MPITVITGPPGAGKTTVADAMARSTPLGVHLVADQCFHWIVSGYVPPWLPESNEQNATVIGVIGTAAARYACGGYDVIIDGVIGPWFLKDLQEAIGPPAASLRYVVLRPSREVALQRATGRSGQRDLTDPNPVQSMYHAFLDLGPLESHVVDSSDHEPSVTADIVCRGIARGLFELAIGDVP